MTLEAHPNPIASPAIQTSGEATPTPPVPATPVAQAAPVAPQTQSQSQSQSAPTRKQLAADDDAIPDDAEMFEISRAALKKRLDRAKRSELVKAFGTDNVEDILAWKQQAEAAKAREEEQRLAQMTEAERYKVQFDKAQQEASTWKDKYTQLEESYAIREQDTKMNSIAEKHIHPKLMNAIMMEFAMHLQGVDESELQDPQAYAENWFSTYAQENPEFGVKKEQPSTPQQMMPTPPKQTQMPVSNGASTAGRPSPGQTSGQVAQKTLAPGKPNSMSPDEAKRWMRENGYNF